jgi:hypothetical protein
MARSKPKKPESQAPAPIDEKPSGGPISDIPPIGDADPEQTALDQPEQELDPRPPEPPKPIQCESANLMVPLAAVDESGFTRQRITVRLTKPQARAWRRLFVGLNAQDERLSDGQHVTKPIDAVRWLFDRLAQVDQPAE